VGTNNLLRKVEMWKKATAGKGKEYHKKKAGTVVSAEGLLLGGKAAIGLSITRLSEQSELSRLFPL
jgi:hypothetical protein